MGWGEGVWGFYSIDQVIPYSPIHSPSISHFLSHLSLFVFFLRHLINDTCPFPINVTLPYPITSMSIFHLSSMFQLSFTTLSQHPQQHSPHFHNIVPILNNGTVPNSIILHSPTFSNNTVSCLPSLMNDC